MGKADREEGRNNLDKVLDAKLAGRNFGWLRRVPPRQSLMNAPKQQAITWESNILLETAQQTGRLQPSSQTAK